MKNGRENRNNGNQEKGKEEKETLSKFSTKSQGTLNASPKFLGEDLTFQVSRKTRRYQRMRANFDSRFRDGQPWNALFLFRAKTPIRAEVAMLPNLRLEHTVGNSLGRIFDACAGRQQL
jgi:hypothetical protein